jgi:DinB superfamily
MPHSLEDTISLLARTPAALNALLRDLPEMWTLANEGENTWSAYDIVGHLVYAERNNWVTRAKIILDFGETQAFPPFNRLGQVKESQGRSLAQLLDEFARVRSESLKELRGLSLRPEDLDRRGKHPALGAVTLSELLATWAAHDLTHLHQLTRVMAHQLRATVGPFSRFLGVLECAGHSSAA